MKVYIVFGQDEICYSVVLLGIYPTLELCDERMAQEIDHFEYVFYEVLETGQNGTDCHFELD